MQFVANVSHELRTPLTVIRGAAHNLMDKLITKGEREKMVEYTALIQRHAEDLSTMVEQVLYLGTAKHVLTGKMFKGVDVQKTLREAVSATQEETKCCTVDLQLGPELVAVNGDAVALQRAFQNLLVNAAKHGGKGGWIGVTGVIDEESEPPTVEVQIADRGEGIPAEELKHIFEPFYRGTAAEAEQVRGSGLGLSLVKEIVEAHGGTVAVESKRDYGTTFTVRLPATNGRGEHEIASAAG
jgi:signal transduction histidine kinase